jgi:hypothetical protein
MDIKKWFRYFAACGAIYYTVLSAIIMIINVALLAQDSTRVIVPEQFLYLLMFCYIMSLGSSLRRIDTISKALGWVLNASCYVLGFFIFLLCLKMSLPSALILVVAFIPIYAIAAVSVALYERRGASVKKTKPVHKGAVKSKKSNKRKDNETYTSMFS